MRGGRTNRLGLALAALAVCALGAPASHAASDDAVTLTSMRSWSSPKNTRIVFDFSGVVTIVAPDSGSSEQIVLTIPGPLPLAQGMPSVLGVRDGVVDSVEVLRMDGSSRLRLSLRRESRFRVFALRSEEGRPFRYVVDVSRPGGAAAEERRLETIAEVKREERVRIVAVDAGHGGEDSGARGPGGVLEKHVTLAVARALVDALNAQPGVKAVLTRDGDYFIPLRERYRAAERMKADVFISIHSNSSRRRGAGKGTEVYFLSLRGASDQADQDLADAENAADLIGGVPPQAEGDLVNILYDVKRSSALQQSQLLAETLLDHLAADRRLTSRGVKQAGFVVLKSVEFPSVLVETAFINNPVEAKLLKNPEFQKRMGRQLADGVRTYFQRARIGLGEAVVPKDGGETD